MHIVNDAFLQSTPFRFFGSILWIFPGEKISNLFPLGGLAFTLRKKGLLIGTIFTHTHILNFRIQMLHWITNFQKIQTTFCCLFHFFSLWQE